MIKIQTIEGKPIPGAGIEFFKKSTSVTDVISIVTFPADSTGNVYTNDPDLFTTENFAKVHATGYNDYYIEAAEINADSTFSLDKNESFSWFPIVVLVGLAYLLYTKK